MMSTGILLLFLGLIVFGPKKTLEFAQEAGRLIAHFKQIASQTLAGEDLRIPQPHRGPAQIAVPGSDSGNGPARHEKTDASTLGGS
jgi:Sec-independent protein translocase protein TatA